MKDLLRNVWLITGRWVLVMPFEPVINMQRPWALSPAVRVWLGGRRGQWLIMTNTLRHGKRMRSQHYQLVPPGCPILVDTAARVTCQHRTKPVRLSVLGDTPARVVRRPRSRSYDWKNKRYRSWRKLSQVCLLVLNLYVIIGQAREAEHGSTEIEFDKSSSWTRPCLNH